MNGIWPFDVPWEARDGSNLLFSLYEGLDHTRRWQGWTLDTLGWLPMQTPSKIIFREPGVTLKGYGDEACPGAPVLLLVPAPIKRAYIWDLAPGASVVELCLQHGFKVYLLQWESPSEAESEFGLAEYADRLILDCLKAIAADSQQSRVFIAAHSLGGTLAAIFTALHQEQVRGLVLLGSPLRFGAEVGVFGPFAALAKTFGLERCEDWLKSLSNLKALCTNLQVERWTLDEMPMPQRLFEEVVDRLIQADAFMSGTLKVGKRRAAPETITVPVLCVADARCDIVPPEAILPFYEAVKSDEKKLLWYEGDTGVCLQHVGFLVGETAHGRLWPEIAGWIHTQAKEPT